MPQLHVMRHRLNQILCLDNGKGIDRIIGIDRAKGKVKVTEKLPEPDLIEINNNLFYFYEFSCFF